MYLCCILYNLYHKSNDNIIIQKIASVRVYLLRHPQGKISNSTPLVAPALPTSKSPRVPPRNFSFPWQRKRRRGPVAQPNNFRLKSTLLRPRPATGSSETGEKYETERTKKRRIADKNAKNPCRACLGIVEAAFDVSDYVILTNDLPPFPPPTPPCSARSRGPPVSTRR